MVDLSYIDSTAVSIRSGWNRSQLTEEDVLKIREDNRPKQVIAADYGVSHAAIWKIQKGLSWRHLG